MVFLNRFCLATISPVYLRCRIQYLNLNEAPRRLVFMSTLPSMRLVVSSNGEQYRVVDVTGATHGSCIRERIYSKLCIADEHQRYFSVYPSEIGSFALAGPLSDRRLFSLCQERGDSSGSLKFFVSTSPDRPSAYHQPGYTTEFIPSFLVNHS